MSKSGGDFGPINALGLLAMIAGSALLAGVGIFSYRIAEIVDKELIQQALNICGVTTIAIVSIAVMSLLLVSVARRNGRDAAPPTNYYPSIPTSPMGRYNEVPPQLLQGSQLPPPPSMPMLDIPETDRGHVDLAGADRRYADGMREDTW